LLAKADDGLTAWDIASFDGKKEILETLWVWGREVQINLKDDLLIKKKLLWTNYQGRSSIQWQK
jgi:hypothetical protein